MEARRSVALPQRATTTGIAVAVTVLWGMLLGTTLDVRRVLTGDFSLGQSAVPAPRITYVQPPVALEPLPPTPPPVAELTEPRVMTAPFRPAADGARAPSAAAPRDTSSASVGGASVASREPALTPGIVPLRPGAVAPGRDAVSGTGSSVCVGPCTSPTVGTLARPSSLPVAAQDSIRRAMGGEVARAAPVARASGTIRVGLPGGGPSAADRARDRALHATITAELDAFRAGRDSIRADSIRADSVRRARGGGGG